MENICSCLDFGGRVICTALYFTRSAWCVWGLCLPAMLSYSSNGGKEDKADSKQTEHEL